MTKGSELEPLYERYIDRKLRSQIVIPIARSVPASGKVSAAPLPPILGARIRKTAPLRRAAPTGFVPGGLAGLSASGKYLVWAGHLQKCVDEDTGEVYYMPVVYIIEMAAAPNNKPVPK